MARFKRKRGGSRKAKSIPIAIAIPLAVVGITQIADPMMKKDWPTVALNLTGVNYKTRTFHGQELIQTYGPIAAGLVIHKIANRVGMNNYVRKATMGYLSI